MAQPVHAVEASPSASTLPRGQAVHDELLAAACVPLLQLLHEVARAAPELLPAGQTCEE